jgi:hydrogenase small subunit
MKIARRDFLKYCGLSAAAIGLSASDLGLLEKALANPNAPTVAWIQGASCVGCSISLLDRISTTAPVSATDLLVNSINLTYHPTLMGAAGNGAVSMLEQTYNKASYVLVVEGGIPTAFGGNACMALTQAGREVTFQEVVTTMVSRAAKIVCVGTCAAWGGIPAAPPNPTAIKGVKALTGKTTINIAGCPANPDWIVWAIVQILTGKTITLDGSGRPTALYSQTVHSICPRRGTDEADRLGIDGRCLKELGCRGPATRCNCPSQKWNNRQNWCIGANAPCIGCTEPTFPGTLPFYREGGDD